MLLLLLLLLTLALSFGSKLFLREDRTALDATQPVRGGKLLARHEPRLFYASGEVLRRREEEEEEEEERKRERDVSEHHAVPPEVINPCGKEWNAGDLAYRCRDCQKTNSSSVCVSCFKESDHVGHDFTIYRSEAGGVCDCGDRESWAVAGSCARHGGKCNKDEEEEEERDEEVEGEREEEKKEVWDSTSVNGLLRVRKKRKEDERERPVYGVLVERSGDGNTERQLLLISR